MLLCIFEDTAVANLYPFTRTRATYLLRVGHRTILETLRDGVQATGVVLHCRPELAAVVGQETELPVNRVAENVDVLFVNGRLFDPEGELLRHVVGESSGQDPIIFRTEETVVAAWVPARHGSAKILIDGLWSEDRLPRGARNIAVDARLIKRLWDMLDFVSDAVRSDFGDLSHGYNIYERPGADVSEDARLINEGQVYVGPGARIATGAVLDATNGPIIIGRDANVMEYAVIHGPASVGTHALVKSQAHIEASVIGPWCKVGGEIHGSIVQSYSNKAHAGYLGDSIVGSWCNIGADTNTSNLRNDYGNVSLYNEARGEREDSGRIFAGLFMGDHSKCGIDTMFNTGSVIGVSCNLYGAGYQPRYVPSFTWGSPPDQFTTYRLDKALRVAKTVMARRNKDLTDADAKMLEAVFNATATFRETGPIR